MLHRGLKTGLAFLITLLILGHGLLLFLFFGPLKIVAGFAGLSGQHFVFAEEITPAAEQAFGFLETPSKLTFAESNGFWRKLNQTILQGRYKKMNEGQRRELTLNTLPFGEDVFGLNAGALYYFQKPLNQLSMQQQIQLAALYQIFKK